MRGSSNVPGASTPEVEGLINQLAAAIMKGTVSAPLTAQNGEIICTRAGQEITARRIQTAEAQERDGESKAVQEAITALYGLIDSSRAACMARIEAVENGIMSGRLTVQLAGRDGNGIRTRSGVDIYASKYFD